MQSVEMPVCPDCGATLRNEWGRERTVIVYRQAGHAAVRKAQDIFRKRSNRLYHWTRDPTFCAQSTGGESVPRLVDAALRFHRWPIPFLRSRLRHYGLNYAQVDFGGKD